MLWQGPCLADLANEWQTNDVICPAMLVATLPGKKRVGDMQACEEADCLPPEGGYFESQQALFELINSWAKLRGYAVIIHGSAMPRSCSRPCCFP